MKTKVYKLAAELGVREDRVLEWLRGQGYPHMRRADMVRAELADAARSALSENGVGGHRRSRKENTAQTGTHRVTSKQIHLRDTTEIGSESLTSSFAELLGEHLERHPNAQSIDHSTVSRSPEKKPSNGVSIPQPSREVIDARLTMERQTFEDRLKVAHAEVKAAQDEVNLLQREVESSRNVVLENAKILADRDRLAAELDQLKAQMAEVEHERTTLDTTCATLQTRLEVMETLKLDLEHLEIDHSSVVTDLEATQQREVAWRARALELERASQTDGLALALTKAGVTTLRMKQNLLTGLLKNDKTADLFLDAIEKIDHGGFEGLLRQHTRRVCANTLCRKCVSRQGRIAIVVDDQNACEICNGDEGRRFFESMVCEAVGAGVRRMLIYGAAPELKTQLHTLVEGHSLDLRLLDRERDVSGARAQGRVDGCDCFVTWTQYALEPNPYLEAARQLRRLWVMVNSSHNDLAAMSRQVAYRLARYSHLATS